MTARFSFPDGACDGWENVLPFEEDAPDLDCEPNLDGEPDWDDEPTQDMRGTKELKRKIKLPPDEISWIYRAKNAKNEDIRMDHLIPGLCRGCVGILSGAGGGGKSYLALEIAYAAATGAHFFKTDGHEYVKQGERRKVKVLNFEDSYAVMWNRVGAIQEFIESQKESQEHNIPDWQGIYVAAIPEYAMALKLVDRYGNIDYDVYGWFKRQAEGMDLMILDPLSQIHAANENDNGQMSVLMSAFKNIAASTKAAILLVHHASKGAVMNGQGELQQATRGASALVDAARLCMTLLRDPKTKAIELSYPKINGHSPIDKIELHRKDRGILIDVCAQKLSIPF